MLLRIAHLTHNAQGGAGRAALRARDACRAAGMVSELFCLDGAEEGDGVIQPKWLRTAPDAPSRLHEFMFRNLQWNDIFQHRRGPSNTLLSQPYPGLDTRQLTALQGFDVLHLHWATWTLTPPEIRAWLDSGRALVWTLHDAWPMTGGCHYPSGCDQFRSECVVCPQLNDSYSLVPNAFADKLRQYGNDRRLQIIAPSPWLAAEARSSRMFRESPIHEVCNGVELDVFTPQPEGQEVSLVSREQLREELGFSPQDVVMLFGNHLNDEVRKGGQILTEALALLLDAGGDRMQAWAAGGLSPAFLTFGSPVDLGDTARGAKTLAIDSVKDDALLANLYRVADVLCFPSVEDNYPNTLVESMACGTPAIVFETGGMASMVAHGKTGWLVSEVGSAESFAEAMHAFALKHFRDQGMRDACRRETEARNAPALVGAQLAKVYGQALAAVGRPGAGALSAGGQTAPAQALAAQPSAKGLGDAAKAIHQHATVKVSPKIGADFFRYPVNRRVARLAENAAEPDLSEALLALAGADLLAPSAVAAAASSVALVSTLHSHHASYAGPYQFCRHLAPKRFEVRHYRTPLGADLVSPGAAERARQFGRILGLEGYAGQANAMVAEFDLLADQAQRRFDVVHFLDGELCGWLYPRAAKRLLGSSAPAVVMSLHQPPAILEKMITRERLAEVDVVLALCETQAEFLRWQVPGAAVRVVPHGVSTDYFRPGSPPRTFEPATAARPLRLLSVGHWLRDYRLALAAVGALVELGIPFEYTIVCHNFPEGLPLPEQAKLVSGLSDEKLLREYATADALLLPLSDATANNAILEAMACGLPVFSVDVGGVSEMTATAACLVAPGDSEALGAQLLRAAEQPEWRRELSERGLLRAAELSWGKVADEMVEVYQEAMLLSKARHAAH